MSIRTPLLCIILAAIITVLPAVAQDADTADMEAEAKSAASDWIAQVDTAAYALSYETAAPVVRNGLTEKEWITAVKSARDQTGGLEARTFSSADYTNSLPNAPEGEYVVIQYQSMFANVPMANELLVMMRTQDGSWKLAGYRVAPVQQPQN